MIWLHDSIAVCLLKSPELHFKTASLPVYVISTYKTYLFLFYPSCLSISTVIWITVPAAETGNRFYTVLNSKILFVALHMSDIDLDVISPPTNNEQNCFGNSILMERSYSMAFLYSNDSYFPSPPKKSLYFVKQKDRVGK